MTVFRTSVVAKALAEVDNSLPTVLSELLLGWWSSLKEQQMTWEMQATACEMYKIKRQGIGKVKFRAKQSSLHHS